MQKVVSNKFVQKSKYQHIACIEIQFKLPYQTIQQQKLATSKCSSKIRTEAYQKVYYSPANANNIYSGYMKI